MLPENFAGVRLDLAKRDGPKTTCAFEAEAVSANAAEKVHQLERLTIRDGARDMTGVGHAALRVCTDPAR
jgi:hypothetical protein